MAVSKQFAVGTPGALVAYLLVRNPLSPDPDYRQPSVMLGDPDQCEWFGAGLCRVQPVTALAISWDEALDDDRLEVHARSLVVTLGAGIPVTWTEYLGVAHREPTAAGPKSRVGLHVLIPTLAGEGGGSNGGF